MHTLTVAGHVGRIFAVPVCLLLTATAIAQDAIDASRVTPRDLRPESTVPAPVLELEMPADAAPAARSGTDTSLSVTVARVRVRDGFADMAAATTALIEPFQGRLSSVEELTALADALETAYNQAGYVLARVTIPPQEVVDDGEFTLLVIDGYLDAVNLDAIPARQRRALNTALQPLVGHGQMHIGELERALILAGRTPGLPIRSTLVPGDEAGATTLVIEGQHKLFSGSWSSDNRLSEALGTWQSTLQLQVNQPLGHGEQVYAYWTGNPNPEKLFTDDRRRIGGAGINWPLGRNGMSVNLEHTASDTYMESGNPFLPDTRSSFNRSSLRLSAPLKLTRTHQINATAALETSTQFNEAPDFGLELFRDELTVFRASLSANQPLTPRSQLNLWSQVSQGLSWGARNMDDVRASNTPLSRPGSHPDFTKLELMVSLNTFLPGEALLVSTVRAQHAFSNVLPSSELFSIDGENAMSALVSGRLAADGGWTVRNELSKRYSFRSGLLSASPFIYISGGIPTSESGPSADYGASAGIGLRASGGPLRASLEYGHSRISPGNSAGNEFFAEIELLF